MVSAARPAGARFGCWKVAARKSPCNARVQVEPAHGSVGELHRRHPLVFETPCGQRLRMHRQRGQQGGKVQPTTQIDAADAGDGFHGAQGA